MRGQEIGLGIVPLTLFPHFRHWLMVFAVVKSFEALIGKDSKHVSSSACYRFHV